MFKVELTKQQLENLVKCLDVALRNGGLASMAGVAELYNALQGAEDLSKDGEQTMLPFPSSDR